jgi:hypothetical protein
LIAGLPVGIVYWSGSVLGHLIMLLFNLKSSFFRVIILPTDIVMYKVPQDILGSRTQFE